MPICSSCHATVPDNTSRCFNCGYVIPIQPEIVQVPAQRIRPGFIRKAGVRRFGNRNFHGRVIKRTSGLKVGFGIGCGIVAALFAIPLVLVFLLWGSCTAGKMISGGKEASKIDLSPKIKVESPLMEKIADKWNDAEKAQATRMSRAEGVRFYGFKIIDSDVGLFEGDLKKVHLRDDCPLYKQLSGGKREKEFVTVRKGKFVNDEGFYLERKFCDMCVE